MQLPRRVESHRLEDESINYFNQCMPREYTASRLEHDYGVDLVVDIFDGDIASSRQLLVQLKSSTKSNATGCGKFERIEINVSTYNFLWEQLQVVLLVKYVASEQTAYWQLLSQVPEPDQSNTTMTIRIPRSQTFSDASWELIRRYVEAIHRKKLSVRERVNLENFT